MPTQKQQEAEELLKKAQEELDAQQNDETPEETPEEQEADTNEEDVIESNDDVSSDEEEVNADEETEDNDEEQVDYKKKFSESSREAQKINAKNRKLNGAISQAGDISNPTDEELQAEYSDWDVMSDTEQKLARDNYINKQRFEIIHKAAEEAKNIEKWSDDVETFLQDPKSLTDNPQLEGREDEFRLYANDMTHHNIPMKVLVNAFLYDLSNKVVVKKKGKMLEVGTGGPNDAHKRQGDKISLAEAERIRKVDYNRYKTLLIQGKIETNIT